MSLLRNRSFNVKVVKDAEVIEPGIDRDPMEGVQVAAAYADVAKDLITDAALTIGGVWAACKIIERICK